MFSRQLAQFQKKTLEKYSKVQRGSVLELGGIIATDTPVLTGVLRNNWYCGIGSPSTESNNVADDSGQGSINRIRTALDAADISKDIFLTNNLPYAAPVEFNGSSGGMVRRSITLWDRIVKRHVSLNK